MKHLKETNSSYFEHLIYSSYFNLLALGIFLFGLIHSVFPFLFEFLPYRLAKKIVEDTEEKFINIKS